jgi:uncharacterized protein
LSPRRIHELFRQRFPSIDSASLEWRNVAERSGLDAERFAKLLDECVVSAEVLVHVHRRVGARLPREAVVSYVTDHLGQGEIRIADREFNEFIIVAVNGAACGWRASGAESTNPAAS